jgi:hypothetical protein
MFNHRGFAAWNRDRERLSRGRSELDDVGVTEFEHRQITAVRKELDQEYET